MGVVFIDFLRMVFWRKFFVGGVVGWYVGRLKLEIEVGFLENMGKVVVWEICFVENESS